MIDVLHNIYFEPLEHFLWYIMLHHTPAAAEEGLSVRLLLPRPRIFGSMLWVPSDIVYYFGHKLS